MCFAVVTNGRVGNLFCLFALTEVRAVQQVLLCALCANSSSSSETSSRSPSFLFASACISEIFPWSKSFLRSIDRLLWLHRPGTGDLLHICQHLLHEICASIFCKMLHLGSDHGCHVCLFFVEPVFPFHCQPWRFPRYCAGNWCLSCVDEWNWSNNVLNQHFLLFRMLFFLFICKYSCILHATSWNENLIFSKNIRFCPPCFHLLFGWKWN